MRFSPDNSDPCLVCGAVAFAAYRERSDGVLVVRCQECDMGVVEEIPGDLSAFYEDAYYRSEPEPDVGYSDYAMTAEHSVAWAASLIRLLTAPGRILDIGSVDGHFLRKLPEYERFGIEVNEGMAELSSSHGVDVIARDIYDPRLLENYANSFDVVSALAVFEHVGDIKRAIEIAVALLKDDGLLLFELPLIATSVDDSVWFRTSLEHIWYPSERALANLFGALDLSMVGREVEIVEFASTYVGIVSRSSRRATIEGLFNELICEGGTPENDEQARFRALFELVHAGRVEPSKLALLPSLTATELNPLLLTRLATLWGSREAKTRALADALGSLQDERQQLLDSLEDERRRLQRAMGEERGRLLGAIDEATRATGEAHAFETRARELRAQLYEIKHSRAYRIGLAARQAKLTADGVVEAGRRLVRTTPKRARRRQAIASAHLPDGPTVSVIMPVYNKGRKVLESVASVRRQTLTSWELIVWNDGSTDDETIEAFDELEGIVGIRLFNAENRGVIAARNAAFARARGEFICCLDADDLVEPTYLEKAVLFLDEHPDVAIAYPLVRCFGDASFDWRTRDLSPKLIAQENCVPVAAVMRREVMEATGGFNPAMVENAEDWELWAHAAALGFRGRVIPEHLFLYRYSNDQGRDAAARDIYDDLRYRINQLHPGPRAAPDRPPATRSADAATRIESASFFLPNGEGRPIVFFVPWLTRGGGGERFVSDVVQSTVADGRTVVVVVTFGCPEGMTDATEEMLKLTPYVYDLTRFLRPETWFSFCRSMVWRLGDPILINVGSTWLYDSLGALRRAGRGRVTVVDQLFNGVGHVARSVAAGGDIDLTLTAHRALERLLVDRHRVPSRVVTVPIGIEAPANGNKRVRAPRERPVIGWIGRLSVEKRPEWFVRLAAELGELATFRLAGEGPRNAEVHRVARHVPSLELLGFVDDALDFIADCDLLVITSEIEGIPLVAMEAIALGTPVITTAIGGLADLIDPGLNGYLVAADRPDELIAQVRELIEHPDALRRLQDEVAKAGLAERFTTPAMMDRFRELLV